MFLRTFPCGLMARDAIIFIAFPSPANLPFFGKMCAKSKNRTVGGTGKMWWQNWLLA